jgi:hypothetical protein
MISGPCALTANIHAYSRIVANRETLKAGNELPSLLPRNRPNLSLFL